MSPTADALDYSIVPKRNKRSHPTPNPAFSFLIYTLSPLSLSLFVLDCGTGRARAPHPPKKEHLARRTVDALGPLCPHRPKNVEENPLWGPNSEISNQCAVGPTSVHGAPGLRLAGHRTFYGLSAVCNVHAERERLSTF